MIFGEWTKCIDEDEINYALKHLKERTLSTWKYRVERDCFGVFKVIGYYIEGEDRDVVIP